MRPILPFKGLSLTLAAAIAILAVNTLNAQNLTNKVPASPASGSHLNRIFSSNSSYGPLGQDRTIAAEKQIMLFWSEPPANATTADYDAYHFQIMNYLTGQPSVPPDQLLNTDGSLSGDSVTDASNQNRYPAIGGNKHSVVLAGSMMGNGYDQVATVWETYDSAGAPNTAKVFASAFSVNSSTLSFDNSGITGEVVGNLTTSQSSVYDGQIRATMADLLGTGKEDLIIAWHDPTNGNINIAVYGWSASAASHLTLLGSTSSAAPVSSAQSYYSLFDIAAGNFTDDTTSQIALTGFNSDGTLYIKLFELGNNGSIVAKGSTSFNAMFNSLLSQIVITSGDFTGDNYRDYLALALTSNADVGSYNTTIYIAHPDTSLQSVAVSADSSAAQYEIQPNANPMAESIACGDLNGDGVSEIVLDVGNEVSIIEPRKNGSYLFPDYKTNTFVNGTNDFDDYLYSSSFLKVSAVDQSRNADIVVLRNEYNDDGSGNVYQALDVAVISADSSTFSMTTIAEKNSYMPENLPYINGGSNGLRRHYALALGDFNGGSLTLGPPEHFYETNIVQPLVILNAPPVHFDVFNDTSYDICNAFNNGSGGGLFTAVYDQSQSTTDQVQSTVNSSWGVGASLSGSASYLGAKVEASLDTHYGQDFSRVSNSSHEETVDIKATSEGADKIFAITVNYDIWEYPVLDSGQVRGHVLVTVPSSPTYNWIGSTDWGAYSYIPDHLVDNALSYYPAYDSLKDNPSVLEPLVNSLGTGFDLGKGSYSYTLTTSDLTSNSSSLTQTFKMNVSAKATVGGDFAGIGASLTAGVSGDYSNSNLTSHTTTVGSSMQVALSFGQVNSSIGEDGYTVYPYVYWAKNGALVIDYAVDVSLPAPGGSSTWWSQMYGQAPDPALALPYLHWPQEGNTVQDPSKIYQTSEIFSSPSNPAPGDTVTTSVRIHNYSLIPTDTSVQVSFYVGNPDNGGTIIKSLSGDSVFSTSSYIPSRGSQIVTVKWLAPSQVNTRLVTDFDYVQLWAVVDPGNTMKEIHKSNNRGWSILEVPGIVTSVNGKTQVPVAFSLGQNYPNPFNPTSTISYSVPKEGRVTLKVYDILSREVATLVDAVKQPGRYHVSFDGSRYASGVYFYRLSSGGQTLTKKMLLLK